MYFELERACDEERRITRTDESSGGVYIYGKGREDDRKKMERHLCAKETWQNTGLREKKVCFYIAQYPVRWTAHGSLHFSSPGRPVHSDTNSASPGSILVMQQLCTATKHSHFHHRL